MEEFEKVRSFIKLGIEDIKVQVHVEKDCQSTGDRETLKKWQGEPMLEKV